MKRSLLISIGLITLFSISTHAQMDSVEIVNKLNEVEQQIQQLQESYTETQDELLSVKNKGNSLQRGIYGLSNENNELSTRLDSLNTSLVLNIDAVEELNRQLTEQKKELSGQISETRETTSKSVSELDKALGKSTLYWIIAVLVVALLALLAFFFLRKKVTDNQSSLKESLANTRKELEQETIRLDEKLIQVMENQMKVFREGNKIQPEPQSNEQDHSLALKVADEIVRIEKNISRMDDSTKGLKQLSKAVERIKDNFASNGYEMVALLDKPYEEGLKASVTFRPDSDMKGEKPKITRVIKPQVNHKGIMIQQAQIEVSQPE